MCDGAVFPPLVTTIRNKVNKYGNVEFGKISFCRIKKVNINNGQKVSGMQELTILCHSILFHLIFMINKKEVTKMNSLRPAYLCLLVNVVSTWRIQGGRYGRNPPQPNLFHFHAVFWQKSYQIIGCRPKLRGDAPVWEILNLPLV